jgi:transporter family protein
MDTPRDWLPYALGSAAFAAATALLGKLGVAEINSNLATVFRTVVVLAVAAVLVTARGEWESPARVSRFGLLMLLLSGVATGLSWLCYYRALRSAPASLVAPVDKLSVAIVIVLSVALLGEPLTWRLAVGGVLVTAGVLVLARA